MNVWPYVIDVRVLENDASRFRMWLPLFMFWPLLFVLVVLGLVATIVVDALLLVAGRRYHHYTALLLGMFGILADLRGLKVYLTDDDKTVDIAVR